MDKFRLRRTVSTATAILITGLTAGFVIFFFKISLPGVARHMRGADASLLGAAGAVSLGMFLVLGTHKLWLILRAVGANLSIAEVLMTRMGSGPVNLLLPQKTGDIIEILFYHKHKSVPLGRASGAVVFDRAVNLIGGFVWLAAGLTALSCQGLVPALQFAVVMLILTALVTYFVSPAVSIPVRISERIHPRFGHYVSGLLSPFSECTMKRRAFFLVYGIIYKTRGLLVCYLLFRAFGLNPDIREFITYASAGLFAGQVPSIAGFGPRETAMVVMFSGMADADVIFSIAFLTTILLNLLPMALGLPWVPWLMKRLFRTEDRHINEA